MKGRLWVLNFDADDELAHPDHYRPNQRVLGRFAALALRVGRLVPDGDVILREWETTTDLEGPAFGARRLEGRAFCPTPRALALLTRAGANVPASPSLEVLRRVNHRAFCAELGQTLPLARFVRSPSELETTLAAYQGPWLLKRAFGYAGKGQLRLPTNRLDARASAFVRASLTEEQPPCAEGVRPSGLQLEPWVVRRLDVALHGWVSPEGELTVGEPTRAVVDPHGVWQRTERLSEGELTVEDRAALAYEAERVANALRAAGYFGPFGIDAFRYVDLDGTIRFNPRCEINARYSMGWAEGMGDLRPDL
jgi:hypothetical protein